MSASIAITGPAQQVLLVAWNAAVSAQTGWDIGFWWAELTHAYWEFVEHGYQVEIASREGGELRRDSWSDPRDVSGYSADDLIRGRNRPPGPGAARPAGRLRNRRAMSETFKTPGRSALILTPWSRRQPSPPAARSAR